MIEEMAADLRSMYTTREAFRDHNKLIVNEIYLHGLPDKVKAVYDLALSGKDDESKKKIKSIRQRVRRLIGKLEFELFGAALAFTDPKTKTKPAKPTAKVVPAKSAAPTVPAATVPGASVPGASVPAASVPAASVQAVVPMETSITANAEPPIEDGPRRSARNSAVKKYDEDTSFEGEDDDYVEDEDDEDLMKAASSFHITEQTNFTGIISIPLDFDVKIVVIGDELQSAYLTGLGFRNVTFKDCPDDIGELQYDIVFYRNYKI
jgi:hypothetical protein